MRIISGAVKGCKLVPPTNLDIRPTADRTKEAIFSIINEYLPNANFLDLFSGTGAIGIEALSRGVKSCVFVDNHKKSIQLINENIMSVQRVIPNLGYEILNIGAKEACNNLKNRKFDIIFMDPPYNNEETIQDTLKAIHENSILDKTGFIIIEQSEKSSLPAQEQFKIFKIKNYGKTSIIFMHKNMEEL